MSLTSARQEMIEATASLAESVTELVQVIELRPESGEIAMVDRLAETVLELQASVADASDVLNAAADVRGIPAILPRVDRDISSAVRRYWLDLRSYDPIADLRAVARERGRELRTWQWSVEQSILRCQPDIERAAASVSAACHEVAELLSLQLLRPGDSRTSAAPYDPPAAAGTEHDDQRRSS
ncbi:hypothetical protein [Demequina mangrovi]|uniref:Uncharacterized protein n=1 Tax=Demequina mangrovi TaxID=1043493 RepID=A0A1H6UJM8_9MICO|nr:hypothetical protein [Demequina mangrovi]SEI92523.1 hypothetical protein SAMN05421637_0432 [Demequina mangrovi]